MSVTRKIQHYQRRIEEEWGNEDRVLHCISKLYVLPVTLRHLESTGIGKAMNSLKRYDGTVGEAARALVAKWKNVVLHPDSSERGIDEHDVPDTPGSYSPEFPANHQDNPENDTTRPTSEESKDRSKSLSHKLGSSRHSSKQSSSGTERSSNSETEEVSRKITQSFTETSVRKESSGKDKRRDKEREDSKHKSKSEAEKKSHVSKDSKKEDRRRKSSHSSSKHSSKSKSSHSSSSSKNHNKHHDADPEKDRKNVRDTSKTSKNSPKDPKEQQHSKKEMGKIEGIDSQSGTSFADALGMCMMPPPSRKRNNNAATKVGLSLLAPNVKMEPLDVKMEPLDVKLDSTLPDITPNYKPLPVFNSVQKKMGDECLSEIMSSRNQRTKVYSGNKTTCSTVPSLYESCIRVLIDNIDALEVTGGVPYYILKPVLERASAEQLFSLEHHNPYLIEDTNELWKYHCNKKFRNAMRQEMESWREMYFRCFDETAARLKALTENIKQSKQKALPVRSTIQVYDYYQVKPPRNVLKQQAKYGTGRNLPLPVSDIKKKLLSAKKGNSTNVSATSPVSSASDASAAINPVPIVSRSIARFKPTSSRVAKKTKAPLMAKALQLIKASYRR